MNFEQATVFVTGANRGIGRALVDELTRRGVKKIYAAARKTDEIAASDLVVPVALDITDRQAVKAAAQRAADVNLLINNAGALAGGSLLDAPLELIARDLETNYLGTLNVLRAFAPNLVRHGGAVANILSVVSFASMPGVGGYSASKAAAHSLTQAVRADLRPQGVSVHGVYPGPVDTDMAAEISLPKTSAAEVAANILQGIADGTEDIFPDPMAQHVAQLWLSNPKALESQFAQA